MSPEILLAITAGLVLGVLAWRHLARRQRRAGKRGTYWSIGYQRSSEPLNWNPAVAKVFVRQEAAEGVTELADPFLIRRGDDIYLICEVIVSPSTKGCIAVSAYDSRRDRWDYRGVILEEPFHLSYPYVFAHGSDVYMVPEAKGSESVRLYRATDFPFEWKLEKVLIENRKLVDPSIVNWNGRWYLLANRRRRVYLYHSDSLTGEWRLHRASPMWKWRAFRGAGRLLECDGKLYRFTQERRRRGTSVCAYRIKELSPDRYRETAVRDNPILEPCGDSWAKTGMHHVDILELEAGQYFAVFDGRGIAPGEAVS